MSAPHYEVQKILQEAIIDSKPHYLIKWKDYSAIESTWEPIENLVDTLDIVHAWKVKNSPHSSKGKVKSKKMEVGERKEIGKTRKIAGKEHEVKERQVQAKLNQKSKKRARNYDLSSDEEDEEISVASSLALEKEAETSQFSFGDRPPTYSNTRSKSPLKNPSPKPKPKSPQKLDLNGFRVVGKVTKNDIKTVMWCFDWQEDKVCEVELRDGRRANMKRDDVRKICPEKLIEYYEKLQRAGI